MEILKTNIVVVAKRHLKKFIGKIYGVFCYECGEKTWFDQVKSDLGYRTGEQCLNPECPRNRRNKNAR